MQGEGTLTMATFIMLTRLSHQALRSPSSLKTSAIFTAPDIETATKVAALPSRLDRGQKRLPSA